MADEGDILELARLLGGLYTEVFQRKSQEENKPLSQSIHKQDRMIIKEQDDQVLHTATNVYVWGPGGLSNFVNVDKMHAGWGASFDSGIWG